jgi:opacity protein-like surface antigen
MNYKIPLQVCLTLGLNASLAGASDWQIYAVLGTGAADSKRSQDVTLNNNPLVNRYVNDSISQSSLLLGVGLDKQFASLKQGLVLRLGIEGVALRNTSIEGTIHPFVNGGSFDTRRFGYDLDNCLLLAKGRFITSKLVKSWKGYFDLGAGVSLNRLSNYYEYRPQGSSSVPMADPFRNHTSAKFAFSLGLGITTKAGRSSEFSIGYRYINTGNGVLSRSQTHPNAVDRLTAKKRGDHFIAMSIRV